ncbi:MAG: glycosyltransferase family 4 protein [Alphaproteobacteria bacterium]
MPETISSGAKPKLLYIINHIDWFWSHRLPLAAGARDAGWDVVVCVEGASKDTKLTENDFTGRELPPADKGFAPFAVLAIIAAIHHLIKEERPVLLHAITLKYAFMAGLAARFHKDIRVVHTLAGLGYLFSGEGTKPKILRALVGPFLKLALKHKNAQIIFQNPDDLEIMLSRGFVRKEQTYLIRGSGVDTEAFRYVPEEEKSSAENDTPIVVMPTRLVHDKGVAVFVEAARLLKKRGSKARFQIAGGLVTNNPLAISKEEMDKFCADGAVEWLGKVSDMPGLLARATLIVYPSYYREGIPKVLLESCATGRAIVTTDHPGCREAVTDGDNGLLVPVKDPQATAAAIEKLLADPQTRKAMGARSRARAEDEFDVRKIVKATLDVYGSA